ncbi:MAG: hypothetical protein ACK4UV_05545, partial [Ignavibacterium sp.]
SPFFRLLNPENYNPEEHLNNYANPGIKGHLYNTLNYLKSHHYRKNIHQLQFADHCLHKLPQAQY